MSIDDLLPVVSRLVQLMLQQPEEEEGIAVKTNPEEPTAFDPRSFYGRGQATRERVDAYLTASREGWER